MNVSVISIRSTILLPALAWGLAFSALNRTAIGALVDLGANNFGHLSQNDPGLAGVCTANSTSFACGPVAAVNSFVYLQRAFPNIYDNNLIENGNLVKTATDLSAPGFMNCAACAGGTDVNNFSDGKRKWIEGSVPGKTAYSFKKNPSIFDLLLDLSACIVPSSSGLPCGQDTELLVGFYDRSGNRVGGHYVTLYMASTGPDGMMLGFIDPDPNPAGNVSESYTILGGALAGVIQINNYGGDNLARVDYVIDESAIPEPGTILLVVPTLLLIGWISRMRARNFFARQS